MLRLIQNATKSKKKTLLTAKKITNSLFQYWKTWHTPVLAIGKCNKIQKGVFGTIIGTQIVDFARIYKCGVATIHKIYVKEGKLIKQNSRINWIVTSNEADVSPKVDELLLRWSLRWFLKIYCKGNWKNNSQISE